MTDIRKEQVIRYRPHRGSLADSMALTVDIPATREALVACIREELGPWPTISHFDEQHLHITPYYGDDDRIGWKDVHIVTLDGYGVLGFCEGPL